MTAEMSADVPNRALRAAGPPQSFRVTLGDDSNNVVASFDTLAQMRAELYGTLLQVVGHRWTALQAQDGATISALRITAYNERHGDDGAGGDAYEEMTLRNRDLMPW